ncbi:MAG: aldolase/citrate lyase family protein, partial [Rhodothalassiaceae bacterium]
MTTFTGPALMTGTIRPRRSFLYVPGGNARAIEKARTLGCDGIIFDLEDSVAPDEKAAARSRVAAAIAGGGFGEREIVVRVNARATPWGEDDLAAIVAVAPDGVLLPKVGEPEDLRVAAA